MKKYEIIEIIGEGAYGIVFKARNKENGELVAIKKMKDSVEKQIRMKVSLQEVKALKELNHNYIVKLLEAFKKKGILYLVFEYVEKTLLEIIGKNYHILNPQIIKKILYQLISAVNYCHKHNYIHRDIKPENILIDP